MRERGGEQSAGSLLVVSGPPGAGKSTVARVLSARYERSVLVRGDDFFGFLDRGAIEPWLAEASAQNMIVIGAAAAATGRYSSGGYRTIFDGLVGPWSLPTFAAATGLEQLDYVILLPSVARCVQRVATRTGHGFSDETATRKMHHEFASAEVEPRHLLLDPPEGAEAVAALITNAAEQGALRHVVG